ncbi:hypothetical protein BH11PSE5_BH11PSE5_04990 [soil metagenome]
MVNVALDIVLKVRTTRCAPEGQYVLARNGGGGRSPENSRAELGGDAFFIQLAKQGINFGSWNWSTE